MERIRIELTKSPKPKPQDESKLEFGKLFTDHMFAMDYNSAKGWYDPRIVPYGPIPLDPAATCLHYGQLIFEGLKAYRAENGKLTMFRPEKNMQRFNISNARLCMPEFDTGFMVDAVKELVKVDEAWVPSSPGTSLYIRPFMLSTDAFLGVKPSDSYLLLVILSPVGPYYKSGIAPVSIYVEDNYVRAVRGGIGFAKSAANYAASLKAQVDAQAKGFTQVLWLDGVERKYIEEVGTMNIFFVLDNEVVTPELNGSILPGITRDSTIELLKSWNLPVSERRVSIDEIEAAHEQGRLKEVFGTGTAAVISPVGELILGDKVMQIGEGKTGELSQRLYDEINGIQRGEREDKFGWVYKVN